MSLLDKMSAEEKRNKTFKDSEKFKEDGNLLVSSNLIIAITKLNKDFIDSNVFNNVKYVEIKASSIKFKNATGEELIFSDKVADYSVPAIKNALLIFKAMGYTPYFWKPEKFAPLIISSSENSFFGVLIAPIVHQEKL